MTTVYNIFLVISGLFGLVAGSFINVITMRWSADENLRKNKPREVFCGRSHCLHCGKTLKWYHMIPILSFLALKGKCVYCKEKISWQYPLVEILTALVFVGVTWKILSLDFFRYYFFSAGISHFWVLGVILIWFFYSAVLIALSVIDLKHFILPDKLMFPAMGVALLADVGMYFLSKFQVNRFPKYGVNFLGDYFGGMGIINPLLSYLVAAVGLSLFLFLLYFFSRGRAMGFGDVKFAILLGLMLGVLAGVMSFFLAFIIGAIISIFIMIFFRKKLRDPVPFGPFLALGAFVAVFWGDKIINFYLSLFKI